MAGLWSENPLVCMRAADAAEKITRERSDLLRPYQKKLLHLMHEARGGWPSRRTFVRASVNWMPHPWRFHGWAAMPTDSGDFGDVKLQEP
jgi:hypothetical protein